MRRVPPAQPFRGVPPQPVPIIGQQQASQAQQQAQMQAAISQAIQSLAMGIYSRLATAHLGTTPTHPADPDRLRQLAKDSTVAARAYFEGIGVIESQAPHTQQPEGNGDGKA